MLGKDYESFLVSFNNRLDRVDGGYDFTRRVIGAVETSLIDAEKSWITALLLRCALIVGYTLLPERVKHKYQLEIMKFRFSQVLQVIICATLWLVYPFLLWIPLRGTICILLVLEPSLRPTLQVCASSFTHLHPR
jgi:hypothetical protein